MPALHDVVRLLPSAGAGWAGWVGVVAELRGCPRGWPLDLVVVGRDRSLGTDAQRIVGPDDVEVLTPPAFAVGQHVRVGGGDSGDIVALSDDAARVSVPPGPQVRDGIRLHPGGEQDVPLWRLTLLNDPRVRAGRADEED